MGLAALPSASEGVLCVILVNTAMPFAVIRYLVRAVLFMVGVHLDLAYDSSEESEDTNQLIPVDSYVDEFRSKMPAVKFDSVLKKAREEEDEGRECTVCLNSFELDSEINQLACGHVFHKACLDQWMDYWNLTCPLCRTPLMVPEGEAHCPVW